MKNGEPIRSSVELLTHLLRDQADVLSKIVRDAIQRVDGIENNLLAGKQNRKRANMPESPTAQENFRYYRPRRNLSIQT